MTPALRGVGEMAETTAQPIPLRRTADAAEVAETIVFLARDGAGYISGAVVPVDGGRVAILDPTAAKEENSSLASATVKEHGGTAIANSAWETLWGDERLTSGAILGFFQDRHRTSLLFRFPSPGTKGRASLALSK
jgi:Enoyl-(Acyl carrier protein) reductase